MKIAAQILGILFLSAAAQAQDGLTLGQLQFAGSNCRNGSGSVDAIIVNGNLNVPVASSVVKASEERLKRGTCHFILPIQVAEGYRLVVKDAVLSGFIDLSKATTSNIQFEIFKAGSKGEIVKRTDGSESRRERRTIRLVQDGEVLKSECGESLNLRGNTSILLQGEPRAYTAINRLQLGIEVERCD